MSLLTVLTDDHPTLRKKSKKIELFNEEIKTLADDMIETMKKEQGVGLAAPQVGELKRLIVVLWHGKLYKEPLVFINPTITKQSTAKIVMEEGCLSLPGRYAEVPRCADIELKYQDLNGNKKTLKANRMNARIIQHEIDHLDGILFPDRAVSALYSYTTF